jgi:glycosyltransferase involved in cell wall biosynthesis
MNNFRIHLNRETPIEPAVSVICINKNHADYLEDNILSVFSQKFDDYEFIVADGGSTDNSLEIIKSHPFIRLVSGKDSSRGEGLIRALAVARGRYVMVTTSTDGYLSPNWLSTVVKTLDNDPKVALVYGGSARMSAENALGINVWLPPQPNLDAEESPEASAQRWLLGGLSESYLPELNYCVRAEIFKNLFADSSEFPELNSIDPILRFHFEFHRLGYIPRFLPILANFGRTHENQEQFNERHANFMAIYQTTLNRYRVGLTEGRYDHLLRSGDGTPFLKIVVPQ